MAKRFICVFLFSLFFTSCDFDIANNTRLTFTGAVTDEAGNPIPDVYLYLEGEDYVGGSIMSPANKRNENLGENYSDNLGNFQVISLKTSINNFHINRSEESHFYYDEDSQEVHSEPTHSDFTSVDYVNVPGSMDLGTIELRKKAGLNFKIQKTSTSNDTLSWTLSYTHATCYYLFENGLISEEESSCYEFFSDDLLRTQVPSEPGFENTYATLVGGTAEFTYQINEQTGQTIVLQIDETEETYVFDY